MKFSYATKAQDTRLTNIALEDVVEQIRSEKFRATVEHIRGLPQGSDEQVAAKKALAYFVPGTFSGPRSNENLIALCGCVWDLDNLNGAGDEVRRKVASLPITALCFESPRRGLKLLTKWSRPVRRVEHDLLWPLVAEHIKQLIGVLPDPGAKAASQACFLSHDPKLIFNPDADALDADVWLKQAAAVTPETRSAPTFDINTLPVSADCKKKIQCQLAKGHRSEAEFSVLCSLLRANVPVDTIFEIFDTETIGEKYREKGTGKHKWLLSEIKKARQQVTATIEGAAKKMNFVTLDALLKEPPEVVKWLVYGLLPAGGFSLMSAKPKVAKSTLARQEALAVARGDLFLGRETQQGAVIYCVFEEKRAEVADHFRAMGAEGEENIHFFFDVAPENLIEQLKEKIAEVNPVLIILDTLFKGIRVKDLNDYAQTTASLEPLLDLTRKSGAHVQGLHHEKKNYSDEAGGRVLGSTGIYAQFDTIISISRNPADNKRQIQSIQRYGEDMPATFLVFDKDTRMTTIGGSVSEIKMHDLREGILHFLASCDDGATENEIHENIEGRKEMKVKTIRDLLRDGDIFRTGQGKRNCPFRYFINSEISQDYKVNIKKVVPVVPEYKSSAVNGEKDAVFVSGISGSRLSKEPWEPETSIVFPIENFDYKNTGSRGSLYLGTCKKCQQFSDGYCHQYGKLAADVMHCMEKERARRGTPSVWRHAEEIRKIGTA
jgi:hypothetical protein